ncbi:TolC family protein [Nevskia ramosa]|uniref:TolC family protein n=1 Tax=Nevskia ramosa TaxID=64002 RepID=UPI003D0A9E54
MRRVIPIAASTLFVALVAACAVGPNYQCPVLNAPSHVNQQAGFDAREPQAADSPETQASLWQGFDDPVLTTIVLQPLADNFDLAQVVGGGSQSHTMLVATTAALLPSGEISDQSTRFHQSLRSQLGQILDTSSTDFDSTGSHNEIGLGATREIDLLGGRRLAREAAMAKLRAAEAGAGTARSSVAVQVADTYLLVGGPQERRAIARKQIDSAQQIAEYYPKFSLGSLIGIATTGTAALFTSDANQASGVLGLHWRLFDFGRIDAAIEASRGQQAEALAAYKLAALHASEDVENTIVTLLRCETQIRTPSGGEIALTRARAAPQAAYEGGVVSPVQVLNADTRLLAQRDAMAVAQPEASRAAVASLKALGGGWDAARPSSDASLAAR